MGKSFGQLAYIRNLVLIRLSPYEQRPFANFWANSLRGFKRDFNANAPYIIPCEYILFDWCVCEFSV